MRADLHVHSYHSGYNHDLPFLRSRDCYADPDAIYRTAKARGMDIVTITDHDSLDGCLEFLSRHPDAPDFIVGEEITCWTPREIPGGGRRGAGGRGGAGWRGEPIEVHLGAYGMTEQAHREIQPLRRNVFEVIAYLRDARIFFALNHLFHFYKGQVPMAQYLALLDEVPAVEVRNGAMLPAHNRLIADLVGADLVGADLIGADLTGADLIGDTPGETSGASMGDLAGDVSDVSGDPLARRGGGARRAIVAGSDAHTLRRVGRTWTSVPARTKDEFLTNLAAGLGRADGDEGGTLALAADIYGVIGQYWLSLVGLQRHELSWPRRTFGLAFSAVSAPFELTPLLVAALSKRSEARRIRAFAALLGDGPLPQQDPAPLLSEE